MAPQIKNMYLRPLLLSLFILISIGYLSLIHQFGTSISPDIELASHTQTIYIAELQTNTSTAATPQAPHSTASALTEYYLRRAIHNESYRDDDFSFLWNQGDGSPLFLNASKYDERHEIGYRSFVFCPMPKNGCSAWKQVLRRIKRERYYLADDYWSLHSKENNLEQDRIHRFGVEQANRILYDAHILHAVFIRDSIERSLSAFLDKCIGSHWSSKYWCRPRTHRDNKVTHKVYSHFDLYVDAIVNKPKDIGLDFHWLPQNFVCDLYKFADRYRLYYSNDVNARYRFLLDIGGNTTWNKIGAHGWPKKTTSASAVVHGRRSLTEMESTNNSITTKNPQHAVKIMGKAASEQMARLDLSGSFLDKESYHSINTSRRLFQFYRADLLAKLVVFYESDYIVFAQRLPHWICKFIHMESLLQALETNVLHTELKEMEMLSFGEYSIYAKDYDHEAVVNESGVIWTRRQEIQQRGERFTAVIPRLEDMIQFDAKHGSIVHKLRGIVALRNVLSFVDSKILPLCLSEEETRSSGKSSGKSEREAIAMLLELYFNRYLMRMESTKTEKLMREIQGFVSMNSSAEKEEAVQVNGERTYDEWRNEDKLLCHNIRETVVYLRDTSRKVLASRRAK